MRISWLAPFVVACTLAIPAVASSQVHFQSQVDDGDGVFDPAGASGYDGLEAPDGVTVDGAPLFLESCHGVFDCDLLKLSLTWTVGPRISYEPFVDPDAPEGTGVYTYGAGTLTLDGHWGSHEEPGIFVGDITSLVIVLTHECSFGLCGTTNAILGEGRFHDSLAHLLRVSPKTDGGLYGIDTDGAAFFGDFGYGLGDNLGFGLQIDTAVPEPVTICMTALGLLGVASRRRAKRSGSRAK